MSLSYRAGRRLAPTASTTLVKNLPLNKISVHKRSSFNRLSSGKEDKDFLSLKLPLESSGLPKPSLFKTPNISANNKTTLKYVLPSHSFSSRY